MIYSKNLSSRYFQGSWFSQTNVYMINSKKQKQFKRTLSLILNKTRKSNIKWFTNDNKMKAKFNIHNTLKLHKNIFLNENINLTIKVLSINLLKVDYGIILNNFIYEEYIYMIHNNLMFSSGILKEIKHHKYLGIVISSYIKLNN
uniref:Uncharacterized protein n=1 Tax=Chondria sp. (in: red algae) TaxID=1982705 RepID=A0A1Z1MRD4_9FLOR|nr:hypothetical protein [Chondria sp. (in: red algae)]